MAAIVILSVLVGLGRFAVPGHGLSTAGSYEAIAHIWVGALFALGFCGPHRRAAWIALGVLTVLETAMFLMFKASHP